MAARCSWTKSATCRLRRRHGLCASCRTGGLRRRATISTCASSPRPSTICARWSIRVCSAKTSTTGSTWWRCSCRRCAIARKTFRIWHLPSSFARRRKACPRSSSTRAPMTCWSRTTGRATCANSRTSSAGCRLSVRSRSSRRGKWSANCVRRLEPLAGEREFEAEIEALLSRHFISALSADPDKDPEAGQIYQTVIEQVERPLIKLALAATSGNKVRAAALLGLNRNTLRSKINGLGVGPED